MRQSRADRESLERAEKNCEPTGVEGLSASCSRNRRRKRRESTRTGKKKPGRQAIQRCAVRREPPPGTTQCRWG